MSDCTKCTGSAVLGYGSTIEAQNPQTSEWVLICGITNISGPSSNRGEIDVTTLCSTSKEYVLDLKDYGTLEMSGLLQDGNEGQQLLDDLFLSGEKTKFRMTVVDDGYGNGPVIRTFDARVQSQPVTVAMGAANQVTFTLRITGDVITERPTVQGPHLTYTPTVLSESAENDGTVAGVVVVVLSGDTFADPLAGVTFSNVPDGLTATATRITHNTAVINFGGSATDNDAGTTAEVGVAFGDTAFTALTAAEVAGSSNRKITINFV